MNADFVVRLGNMTRSKLAIQTELSTSRPETEGLLRRRGRTFTAAAILSTLIVGATALGAGQAVAAPVSDTTVVTDAFSRTITGGWGSADSSQKYAATSPAVFRVSGGAGVANLKPGTFATQTVPVSERDARAQATFKLDKLPTAGNGVTASVALRAKGKTSYQARARVTKDAKLVLSITRYDGSYSAEKLIADKVVATGWKASDAYTIEFASVGTSPVKLYARAWKATNAAPAWQLSPKDSSAARITAAGAAGISVADSAASPAAVLNTDNLVVKRVNDANTLDPAPTTPTTKPTPSPTPTTPAPTPTTPAPTPSTPAEPAPATPAATDAGSVPVGSAKYAVPAGAVYATAAGTTTGSGTAASPYGSLAKAIDSASAGATIVLRGGTYRESVTIPFHKKLTIQSYPGEAVWLDGSRPVTNWTKSGNAWVSTGYTADFDHRVAFGKGVDESDRWVDPAYPLAGYPDQVWIGGKALTQVASEAKVTTGTFYVDVARDRLVIGSDPSGKNVDATQLEKAITIAGEGSTLRGFGIRRFADHAALMGAVSAEVNNITLENLVITENSSIGLYTWNSGQRFNHLTISDNGLLGMGANKADGLQLTDSRIERNNLQHFNPEPVAGGVKIHLSKNVLIKGNVIADNTTNGLWFDNWADTVKIISNDVIDNGRHGILLEAGARFTVADNRIAGNGHTGIEVFDSSEVDIWNNTISGEQRAVWFMQDERRNSGSPTIPMVVQDNELRNNVIVFGDGGCPILTQDLQQKRSGNDFGIRSDANLYYRASASSPANFACWADGAAGTKSFKTLETFRAAAGGDSGSRLVEGGAPVVGTDYELTATGSKSAVTALPLPSGIASAIGVPTNSQRVGAFSRSK